MALSLGLSYDTARRRLQRFLDERALIEVDGGLVGANEQASPEVVRAMAEQNVILLRQLRDQGIGV